MEPRTLARWHALGRVGLGAALTFLPARTGAAWVGPAGARPPAQVITSAVGARDLAIGLGAVRALREGTGASPWIQAGALADTADLVATLRARRRLPALAVAGVGAMAATSAAVGLWLQRELP